MAKPDAKNWPELKKAWDDYGHSVSWNALIDMKSARGCYVVLAWKEGDMIEVADLARAGAGFPWEMQNDGSEPMSQDAWDLLRVVPECDWYEVPTEEELQEHIHSKMLTNRKYRDAFVIYEEGFNDASPINGKDPLDAWLNSYASYNVMKKIK